jgi:hypothetical protein
MFLSSVAAGEVFVSLRLRLEWANGEMGEDFAADYAMCKVRCCLQSADGESRM